MRRSCLLALLAGGAAVFAFAPFGWFPLALLSLAMLVALLMQAARRRDGFWLGMAWGLGSFLAGVSWLYVALNRFGGMPAPLAALAIVLFCAYLALYPAIAGAGFVHLKKRLCEAGGARAREPLQALALAAAFGGLWTLSEWLRGVVLTGFPWLAIGYSQTPPSPLAGFVPIIGVYGVGGLVAFLAALLVLVRWGRLASAGLPAAVALVVVLVGVAFTGRAWTLPVGPPVAVALVQTDFEQSMKWDPDHFARVLRLNLELVGEAFRHEPAPAIVVLPETTLPALIDRLPEGYVDGLAQIAAAAQGDLILGVFTRDPAGRIFNAAISLGQAPVQHYAKHHLVPFGEYSPPLFGWFYRLVDIPMSDQSPGEAVQRPMLLGGQRVALNICYEDLFGAELIRALPQASLMLNISNLAWYGDSLAQPQHLQIARMRALETGRPMLRSTNTGMTGLIQPDGRVAALLPAFQRGISHVSVQGHEGLTPYARWGDRLVLALASLVVVLVAWRGRRRPS